MVHPLDRRMWLSFQLSHNTEDVLLTYLGISPSTDFLAFGQSLLEEHDLYAGKFETKQLPSKPRVSSHPVSYC